LSKIDPEYWDTTPNHSNSVESAHAARNAETGIRMPLLTAILKSVVFSDFFPVSPTAARHKSAITSRPKSWLYSNRTLFCQSDGTAAPNGKRLRPNAKYGRAIRPLSARPLTSYDTLKLERDTGAEDSKASLERQRTIELQIKSLQEQMRLDRHRSDLKEQVVALRREVGNENLEQRAWTIPRAEIDKEIEHLQKGGLASVHLKGKRPGDRASGEDTRLVSGPVPYSSPAVGRYTDPRLQGALEAKLAFVAILN
jgi:hypothetical protein